MPEPAEPVLAAPPPGGAVDALILCALQDELEGLLVVEGGKDKWEERKDRRGFRVYRRTFDNLRGGHLRVAAAWTGEMGRVDTAIRAQELIDELSPLCLAMCGICAGYEKDVFLGDVIFANRLWSYDEGKEKITPGGEREFLHDVRTYDLEEPWKMNAAFFVRELDVAELAATRPPSRGSQRRWLLNALLEHADANGPQPARHPDRTRRCPQWSDVVKAAAKDKLVLVRGGNIALTVDGREQAQNALVYYPDGLPDDPPFKPVVGAIATGSAVKEDPALFGRIRVAGRKTIGVDMEAAAIGKVAERNQKRPIVVKAVSDYADGEKDDSFRDFACRASATVLLAFLLKHLDPLPQQPDFRSLAAYTDVLEENFGTQIDEELDAAAKHFQRCDYQAAHEAYSRILESTQELVDRAKAAERPALLPLLEQCRLNLALTTLNLQQPAEARDQLLAIQREALPIHGQLVLCQVLATMGERARARSILPPESLVPPDLSTERRVTLQTIDLAEGRIPEDLVDQPDLRARAATVMLWQGDLAGAVKQALEAHELSPDHMLVAAKVILVLVEALRRFVYDLSPCTTTIPEGLRAPLLEVLDGYVADKAMFQRLPERVQRQLAMVERVYDNITGYDNWARPDASVVADEQGLLADAAADPRRPAFRLALEGKIDEALQALPNDDGHPWRRRYDQIQILMNEQDPTRALNEARALANDYPGRVPIESILASLCTRKGQMAEALVHAGTAYRLLPSRGARLLLAGQHLNNKHPGEAWDLMKDVRDQSAGVLKVRMVAAREAGHLQEAERDWKRYVALRPDDTEARVQYAQLLYWMDRRAEAGAVGWSAYEDRRDYMDAQLMYVCGWLQKMNGALDANKLRDRILAVASEMKRRFVGVGDAARLRIALLGLLGSDLPRSERPSEEDLNLLVAQGRAITGQGITGLVDVLRERQGNINAMARLGEAGVVPVVHVAGITHTPVALLVARIMKSERSGPGIICPPPVFTDTLPPLDLRGATILAADLELVLLEALELIEPLRGALGDEGHLVLFGSAWSRLHRDLSTTRIDADPKELERMDDMLRHLERQPDASVEEMGTISPSALVRFLYARRIIDKDQWTLLKVEGEGGDTSLAPSEVPERFVVSWVDVDRLSRAGALSQVVRGLGGRFYLAPDVRPTCRRRRDELLVSAYAAELAARVHGHLGEGWIHRAPDPDVSDVPGPRPPYDPLLDKVLVEPLREMVASRRALVQQPAWWRLTAEIYGNIAFGLGEVMLLAWPDDAAYQALVSPLAETVQRDLTLPVLLRMLRDDVHVLDPKLAEAHLTRLASWGFTDALSGADILSLMRRFDDLDGAEPARILDSMEWMARQPQHRGGQMARARIAYVYGAAVFFAFMATDLTDAQKTSLLGALLHRMEIIAEAGADNALDQSFATIAGGTLDHWQAAFRPYEGDSAILDPESAVARMWEAVSAWAGRGGARRFALRRALRETWRALSMQPGGPPAHLASTLKLAQWPPSDDDHETPSDTEAILILSARWSEDIFVDSPFAEWIEKGKSRLTNDFALFAGRFPRFLLADGEPEDIPVPIEALLLRAPADVRKAVAGIAMIEQAPYDGICFRLLEGIQETPDDEGLLREYAGYAATALFRLVQEDPAFLLFWGQAQRVGEQAKRSRFDELLEILSEPRPPLPSTTLDESLAARDQGSWSSVLLHSQATEIPGPLVSGTLHWWLEQEDYSAALDDCLDTVEHSEEHPIARVARSVLVLRAAAASRPQIDRPEGTVDLREVLPALLDRLVDKLMQAPEPETYASIEAPLLRVCGEVLQRLVAPAVLPLRDGLWLTWRLFQWLCLQLDQLPPDARRAGILHLVAKAPPPGGRRDVLDPFGFGRDHAERFDHRLAAILHAFGGMDALAEIVNEGRSLKDAPRRSVSSPGLEEKLLKLARGVHLGPPVGSVLDWNAPDNIPDLALDALLQLNNARFADLGSEARLRRFRALPDDPQALEERDWKNGFAARIVAAASDIAAHLPQEERTLLEAKLRSMADGPRSRRWRWLLFVSFFATGADPLEAEAIALSVDHVADRMAPLLAHRLLLALAARDPARVAPMMETLIAEVSLRAPKNAVPLAIGALGRLVVHGPPEAQKVAREVLLRLAEREPFRDDPSMNEVIGFFRLRGEDAPP